MWGSTVQSNDKVNALSFTCSMAYFSIGCESEAVSLALK